MNEVFWQMNVINLLREQHTQHTDIELQPLPLVDGQPMSRFEWQVGSRRYTLTTTECRWQLDDCSERVAYSAWLGDERLLFYHIPEAS